MEVCKIKPVKGLVHGHQKCDTRDAKWLCLDNMYIKLHRPNPYDIGGTLLGVMPDFWFQIQTERADKLFLLHIFLFNYSKSEFDISISANSEIIDNEKINCMFLSPTLKNYAFKNIRFKTLYLTTYSFTETVVDILKHRKLFIPIKLHAKMQSGCQFEGNSIFETVLKDPVGADFVMESADGCKFNVHKILLRTFSEVFQAMLKDDTAESQNSYVKLVDVSKDDLSCILEFLYTGSIKNKEIYNFFNILMLADRYDIKGLKLLSESILRYQISEDSVLETLLVADLHDLQYLKQAALQYIKENPKAIHSDTFKQLVNVNLMHEVLKYLVPVD